MRGTFTSHYFHQVIPASRLKHYGSHRYAGHREAHRPLRTRNEGNLSMAN